VLLKVKILVDSTCDLPKEFMENNKEYLAVIGIPVAIGDKEYFDDLGQTFDHKNLYEELRLKIRPSTAQISSYRFYERFKRYIENGDSVFYIGLSKAMSASNRNAFKALKKLKNDYPEAVIKVLESTSASVGQGLLAYLAVEMSQRGYDIEYIFNYISKHQNYVQHLFLVEDLNFLKQGGKLTDDNAVNKNLLNLQTILSVNHEGLLLPYKSVRGRKKSVLFLFNTFNKRWDPTMSNKVMIGHGDAFEEAYRLSFYMVKKSSFYMMAFFNA
jgi:DegV family protein with EDD domain